MLGGAGAPTDRLDFLNSTGAWANLASGVTTTGVDDIDLWIGGLAEKQMPFGGLLGSTFNFVFETQLEALQNGDRFYYLAPPRGPQFPHRAGEQLVRQVDDAATPTRRICRPTFSRRRFILEVDQTKQFNPVLMPARTAFW